MSKKLNTSKILSIAKQEFSFRKIVVTTPDKQEFEVQIQEKLNDTTIMNLISDLVERSNYCTNNIEFNEVLHTYILLIRYFTDIKFSTYKSTEKNLSQDIQIINGLIDLGLFKQIISHFDKETMEKIQGSMDSYAKQLNQVSNNKLKEILENEFQAEIEIKMKKNFKSIKELTDYLNEKLLKAMDGVGEKALKHMKDYVKKEFEKVEPSIYERTYEYLDSIDRFDAWIHSDGTIRTEIYYNADLINPYLASNDFGRGAEYASGQNWNWHANFDNEDMSEYIPLFLEYGTNNPYYSHTGIGGIIDLRKWVQDNLRKQLAIELRKQGIKTK